jgi:Ca2+-binding RTX toxin-like protein
LPGQALTAGARVATYIKGTTGDDTLVGSRIIDIFVPDLGDDVIDGGPDNDYIDLRDALNAVKVDLAITGPQDTGQGRDTLISIENIIGSAFADVLRGNELRNDIQGGAGNDLIEGRGGWDAISGGAGEDEIHGGDGGDSLDGGAGADLIYGDSGEDFLNGGDGVDVLHGGDGVDYLSGDAGDDFIYGDDGNDIISQGEGLDTIDGGAGSDTVNFWGGAITIDLKITTAQSFAAGQSIRLISVENILGSDFDDHLTGDGAANSFTGRAGANVLDGGAGGDTAIYAGLATFYTVIKVGESWQVKDTRSSASSAGDTLKNMEFVKFTDAFVPIGDGWSMMVGNLLRVGAAETDKIVVDLSGRVALGALAVTKVFSEVKTMANATTSVATLSYEFFTGKIPGQAGMDYLISPTGPNANNLNSAYYQSFNLENRYINFAVNLGKVGEGKDGFAAHYGSLSLFDAAREAYRTIFGGTPTDAKVHALIDGRVDYFASYGGDGASGIGTKAAMVGWLLAEAVKADVGVMAKANGAWLMDIADGAAPFAVDLLDPAKGYYSTDFIFGGQ